MKIKKTEKTEYIIIYTYVLIVEKKHKSCQELILLKKTCQDLNVK